MFQKLLEELSLSLERQSIPYMVIGGQALLIHGEPRLTKDIDITLGLGVEGLKGILDLVEALGWKPLVDSPKTFVEKTMVLPCLDPASGIRIDFIFSFSSYEKQALQRVKRVPIGRVNVCFASVEDLVIHKVVAGRPRDLEDVKTVFARNPKMDLPYIRQWLGAFDMALSQVFLKRFEDLQRDIVGP